MRTLPKALGSDSFKEVTERPCIRCQHPLAPDGGQLLYCSNCGAPQIFLSEELQEQTALEVQRYSERTAVSPASEQEDLNTEGLSASQRRELRRKRQARDGRWPMAVEYALLAGGIALALDALGFTFAPLLLIAWLWAISAPILTVGFYNNRSHSGPLTPGFAARLGLLTGLLIAVSCALMLMVDLVVVRYVFRSGTIDTQIAEAVAQVRNNAQSQYGAASAPMIRLLGIPEFRVGFMLWMGTVSAALYLLVSVATAGVAGLLLGRRRAA